MEAADDIRLPMLARGFGCARLPSAFRLPAGPPGAANARCRSGDTSFDYLSGETSMLKKIVLAIGAFVVILLVYAAFRPDAMHIERSASIHAPADAIFPLINDFHSWTTWSPYEKKDPAMTRTFSGAPSG